MMSTIVKKRAESDWFSTYLSISLYNIMFHTLHVNL